MNKKLIIVTGLIALVGTAIFVIYPTKPKSLSRPTKNATESTVLKQYKDDIYGIKFMHNSEWSISEINGGNVDYAKPYIFLRAGTTSDVPCDGLGCLPHSGDRDEFIKLYTLEGAPPLNPYFKILRVRGNKWVTIQVTDTLTDCLSPSSCESYIANAPFEKKAKVDSPEYQTYNDFIDLLSTFTFTK